MSVCLSVHLSVLNWSRAACFVAMCISAISLNENCHIFTEILLIYQNSSRFTDKIFFVKVFTVSMPSFCHFEFPGKMHEVILSLARPWAPENVTFIFWRTLNKESIWFPFTRMWFLRAGIRCNGSVSREPWSSFPENAECTCFTPTLPLIK